MVGAVDGRVTVPWRGGAIELAYREWPGDGAPIVLLHGLSSSARIWDQVAERLAGRWRVIALDQRGHGRSDKPDDGYDFATIVADDRAALAALAVERPVLVGHSWGGNAALQYAIDVEPGPRALVLVDGGFLEPARRMSWEEAEERLRPPDLQMAIDLFRGRMRERLGARWSPAWEAATLANFWVDERGMVQRNLPIVHHMRIVRALYDQRASGLFGRVRCPTLLVPADPPAEGGPPPEQRAFRTEMVELAERALGQLGRTVWMRETVHDVPLHRPDELAALIAEMAL